jgi:16S rRNA (cytosine967-C5)-methyltransferase
MRGSCVRVVTADARAFSDEGGFDRVLLDPPCSGLGTLQSHPDLRWRATPESIEGLVAEQDALLAAARDALRPGGVLVYSICTISPAEERLRVPEPIRTFPHEHGTDGFYIARDGG